MLCCVFKRCCGCFQLQTGSLIIGYILLALKAVWLYFCSKDIYVINKYLTSMDFEEPTLRTALILSVVNEVRLVLEVIFSILLLVGLHKNKHGYLRAFYPPSAICYVVEIIEFIYGLAYFGIPSITVLIGIMYAANVITKIITLYFLLMVRSHYYQTGNTKQNEVVHRTTPKQFKLGIHYV